MNEELDKDEMLPEELDINEGAKTAAPGTNEIVKGFTLSDEQQYVVDRIKDFFDGPFDKDCNCATLSGAAGTGKSLAMVAVVNHLQKNKVKYAIAAPTHKAKYVISEYTGKGAFTLHAMFGLRPNLDIENFSWNDVKFNLEEKVREMERQERYGSVFNKKDNGVFIPIRGALIVDECSMINKAFFDFLRKASVLAKTKILFIGDECQLQPVKAEDKSPCFKEENSIQMKLTKLFRQQGESAVVPVLDKLRLRPILEFKPAMSDKGSLFVIDDLVGFIKPYMEIIRKALPSQDTDAVKIIAFTNEVVNKFNRNVRVGLFKEKAVSNKFLKGDFLVGFENFRFGDFNFFNSSDYIVVNEPFHSYITVPFMTVPFDAYMVKLKSKCDGWEAIIPIVSVEENDSALILKYAYMLENMRKRASEAKKSKNGSAAKHFWSCYYSMFRAFAVDSDICIGEQVVKKKTFNYGYAITTYKSQGSSYGTVFVDLDNLAKVDESEKFRQHEYVALSRTRGNVYLLNQKPIFRLNE